NGHANERSHRRADVGRHARILSARSIRESSKDTDFWRACVISARYRRGLLASAHLAEGEGLSQTFARFSGVSGATGKESHRLSAKVTGVGRLLATPNYCRAVTG